MDLKKLISSIGTNMKKNSPIILTGAAIGGVVLTGISAFRAGFKAHDFIEEKKNDYIMTASDDKDARRTVLKEEVIGLVPYVAPPIIFGGLSITAMVASTKISSKRIAVLSAAYQMTEAAFIEYKDKVKELLGKSKDKKVRESIIQDKINETYPEAVKNNQIIVVGDADVLCLDGLSGRYFKSTANAIDAANIALSKDILMEMFIPVNALYEKLNIPSIDLGEDFGWEIDDLTPEGLLPIHISGGLNPETREPCLCLEYDVRPRRNFGGLL